MVKTMVSYASHNEVLVCIKADEEQMLKEWFSDRGDRDRRCYSRQEHVGCLMISMSPHVRSYELGK